jgi:hypothetical protein
MGLAMHAMCVAALRSLHVISTHHEPVNSQPTLQISLIWIPPIHEKIGRLQEVHSRILILKVKLLVVDWYQLH